MVLFSVCWISPSEPELNLPCGAHMHTNTTLSKTTWQQQHETVSLMHNNNKRMCLRCNREHSFWRKAVPKTFRYLNVFNALGTEKRNVSLSSRYHQRQVFVVWVSWLFKPSTISTSWIHRYQASKLAWIFFLFFFFFFFGPNGGWTTRCSSGRSHLRWGLIPPPPFNSTSNPYTMQAKDCAWVWTQVMEANRERNPPPHLSIYTLVWLLSPCCAPKQCTTNREAIESIPGTGLILSPVGFDLIFLSGDLDLNHTLEGKLTPEWAELLFSELNDVFFYG